jgi:hypothetical protein
MPVKIILVSDQRIVLNPLQDRIERLLVKSPKEIVSCTDYDSVIYEMMLDNDPCIIVTDAIIPGYSESINDPISGVRALADESNKLHNCTIILFANDKPWEKELSDIKFDYRINCMKEDSNRVLCGMLDQLITY